jgi:hypothetical protein
MIEAAGGLGSSDGLMESARTMSDPGIWRPGRASLTRCFRFPSYGVRTTQGASFSWQRSPHHG